MLKNKTILITGGAGFIGSHLCDRFLAEGHRVICVDNLLTGVLKNVSHLRGNPHFDYIKADVSRRMKTICKADLYLHFASPASPNDYLRLPIQTLEAGSLGTINILELARKHSAQFLVASTSEVYGDPRIHPQSESYWGNVNPVGPRSCYDEAKRFAEAITMAYRRMYRMDTRIIRIFNTYGPRMRLSDGRVIPTFIRQVLHGQPFTIYGSGNQTRSFCYIDDMVEGIYRLTCLRRTLVGPVNLGNPKEFSIIQLARVLDDVTGSRHALRFKPLPQDDPKQRKPSIALAKKVLGWIPRVPLSKGLAETIAWYKSRL